MLASNLLSILGGLCLVVAVAELVGWRLALLVLAFLLLLAAYALYTQAVARGNAPDVPAEEEPH